MRHQDEESGPNRAEKPSRPRAPETEPGSAPEPSEPSASPNAGLLDGGETDFERRMYNARHGLADEAEGANLRGRAPTRDLLDAQGEDEEDEATSGDGDEIDVSEALLEAIIEGDEEDLPERPRGVVVWHAWDAAERWLHYLLHGAVRMSDRVGPSAMVRSSAPKGLEIPHQVALFVEETPLYEGAKLLLWTAARLEPQELRSPTTQPLRLFMLELQLRLPHEFYPPRKPLAGIEVEAMLKREDESRMETIDEKFRERYPGLMREGFGAGWKKGRRKR